MSGVISHREIICAIALVSPLVTCPSRATALSTSSAWRVSGLREFSRAEVRRQPGGDVSQNRNQTGILVSDSLQPKSGGVAGRTLPALPRNSSASPPTSGATSCPRCNGTGTEVALVVAAVDSPRCYGKGKIECPRCAGSGTISDCANGSVRSAPDVQPTRAGNYATE